MIATVAVSDVPYWIDKPYDYVVQNDFLNKVRVGVRVFVPFSRNNRKTEAIVLSVSEKDFDKPLKTVLSVIDDEPVLSSDQIKLALFMRERFFCSTYEAVRTMIPVGLAIGPNGKFRVKDKTVSIAELKQSEQKIAETIELKKHRYPKQADILSLLLKYKAMSLNDLESLYGITKSRIETLVKQGYIGIRRDTVYRRPFIPGDVAEELPNLNSEQRNVYNGLVEIMRSGKSAVSLLQGVTGSGKTAVYLHLIQKQLSDGYSSILLVPEIALTPQMLRTISRFFGNSAAILHSGLGIGERYDEWKRIKTGEAKVVVGTRSAIFAPVKNLGLIIIDEEQEETYKSENSPRYNAEDVAKYLCAKTSSMLLLGSATPNVVTKYNAENGNYSYFEINSRFNKKVLPSVKIVDMKSELRNGNGGNISRSLFDELSRNIAEGEQSILFLNRRGSNKCVACGECGFTYKCPNCSVNLTYHSVGNKLVCHYCGYKSHVDNECPDCGGEFRFLGAGTQLIESEVKTLFPGINTIRLDTDVLSAECSHEQIFSRFLNERIPVLIGTQMIAKGLNFENVTLVGVVNADQTLYCGNFRASERTFSLITQVIGRGGRGQKPGRAIIQTLTPENETIVQAASQDYGSFYKTEIAARELQNTPPFSDILSVNLNGTNEARVLDACKYAKSFLTDIFRNDRDCRVLGPAPYPVVKVNNVFRYRISVYCRINSEIRKKISAFIIDFNTSGKFTGVSMYVDYNPYE